MYDFSSFEETNFIYDSRDRDPSYLDNSFNTEVSLDRFLKDVKTIIFESLGKRDRHFI